MINHPQVQRTLVAPIRRVAWRAGRRIYCVARGETPNDMATNGEAYVQACVLKGAESSVQPLTVFDVGANAGEWTRSFLNQLPDERAPLTRMFLFEPIPATYERLSENLANIPRSSVATPFPLAISDRSGSGQMVVLSDTGGTNSLEFDRGIAAGAQGMEKVDKITLGEFCDAHEISHIHLFKCDAEGHDFYALKGALELLEAQRIDVVQFEYNFRWVYGRAYLKDVFDLVGELPYRVARVCSNHVEAFQSWHFEMERFFEGNYLLVSERALGWFDVHYGAYDGTNTYA